VTIVQNFTLVGPRISEISRVEKKTSGVKLKSAPQAIAFGRTKKVFLKGAARECFPGLAVTIDVPAYMHAFFIKNAINSVQMFTFFA